MPRWPLLLPPPAVSTSTSPSCSHGFSSSIVVKSPSRRPSSLAVKLPPGSQCPLPLCHALHHPQFAIAPSIAAHLGCALGPLPPRSRRFSLSRSRCAVQCHRRWEAIVPSLAVKEPLYHLLPLRSNHAVPHHQGAVGRVDWRLRPLVTPLPGLSSGWLSRCLSSRRRLPSAGASHCSIVVCASRPSGWLSHLLASHASTSHLSVPPPLIAPSPLVTPLSGLSSSWLRCCLSSRRHHISVV
jgi:hypothetical protein